MMDAKTSDLFTHGYIAPMEKPSRELTSDQSQNAEERHGPWRLQSAFQPIYSLTHRRAVGFEALLRANDADGVPVPPVEVFASARTPEEITRLDRSSRALHIRNFAHSGIDDGWLFLNLNPQVLHTARAGTDGFTRNHIQQTGLGAHRVVVEILEKAIVDEGLLSEALAHFREAGFLIAVDDFGAGQSNFDRIWRLQPDIVKLDRSLLQNASHNLAARRIFPGLVSLIHEAGCLVLAEGVETEAEAMLALDADADLVQGFFYGRPAPLKTRNDAATPPDFDALSARFRIESEQESRRQLSELSPIVTAFRTGAERIRGGWTLATASRALLAFPRVLRTFLLDGEGRQVGDNVENATSPTSNRNRYSPVANFTGADWSRKPYFRRALGQPGHLQVVGPYLSVSDVAMCVTLSLALTTEEGVRILCCDLEWRGHAHLITGSLGGNIENALT